MIPLLDDPVRSTWLFGAILAIALILGARRRASNEPLFPRDVTLELKGAAILAIFCAHVGYLLVAGGQFLFPLSVGAGLGVNVFLMLTGYGLAASGFAARRTAGAFYRRHLPKLYRPLWVALGIFLTADYLFLGLERDVGYVARSFLGYFPTAEAYADVNSPLWYLTFAIGCYLLFPLLFSARRPWATAIAYAGIGYALVASAPAAIGGVVELYAKHYLAFPIGVLMTWALAQARIARGVSTLRDSRIGPWAAVAAAGSVAWIAVYASGVGEWYEQIIGVAAAALAVFGFLVKPWRLPTLAFLGTVSYEIYLLHWPILSRYGSPYSFLPGWLATLGYLATIVGAGALLRRATGRKNAA